MSAIFSAFCPQFSSTHGLWQLPLQITQNNAAVGADIVREMRSSSSGDPGSPVFSFNEKSSSKKGDRRDTSSRYVADHTGIK